MKNTEVFYDFSIFLIYSAETALSEKQKYGLLREKRRTVRKKGGFICECFYRANYIFHIWQLNPLLHI